MRSGNDKVVPYFCQCEEQVCSFTCVLGLQNSGTEWSNVFAACDLLQVMQHQEPIKADWV